MRWQEKPGPKYGDKKYIDNRFLILPMYLNGEWRWLEFASLVYEYTLYNGWTLISWN